ncbi:MAG: M48 family metallopeptidase [Hyphomicrobiaceae bacterium]|nr:MAG: M48 family metallopeptidase [Hyphomicrobiaceae bacterium]
MQRRAQADAPEIDAPVEVRRHPGARRLTLRVSNSRRAVVVTMPLEVRDEEARHFLARHIDWVRERLSAIPAAVPFENGAELPLRGEAHVLAFVGLRPRSMVDDIVRPVVWTERNCGGAKPLVCVSGHVEHAPRRLKDWLIYQARKDLSERVALHSERLKLEPRRLSVRDQTSRWGSCSTSGLLCFSWRLILAPRFVLDYVAAHEVVHLKEMNHGPRFWALVEKTMPEMRAAKSWLAAHGARLHSIGPSL